MNKILLNLSQLKELRQLSENLQTEKVDIWINEAQLNEMRNFLGGKLYKLMIEDFTDPNFTDPLFTALWFGDDSGEEMFFGLWRAIGLFAISNIIKNNAFNVTRFSNSELDSDIEEKATQTAQTAKASQAYSQGMKFLAEAKLYLYANQVDYPDWIPQTKNKPSSFSYMKVRPRPRLY